eukprot:12954628-Ditylum_brightwellii.AAC.1
MVSMWETLDEDYRLYLANICTPGEFNASSLAERAQLRNTFLEECRSRDRRPVWAFKVKVENDSVSDPDPAILNLCDGDDNSDDVKTGEHARDEEKKPAPIVSRTPSKKRRFTKRPVRMKSFKVKKDAISDPDPVVFNLCESDDDSDESRSRHDRKETIKTEEQARDEQNKLAPI